MCATSPLARSTRSIHQPRTTNLHYHCTKHIYTHLYVGIVPALWGCKIDGLTIYGMQNHHESSRLRAAALPAMSDRNSRRSSTPPPLSAARKHVYPTEAAVHQSPSARPGPPPIISGDGSLGIQAHRLYKPHVRMDISQTLALALVDSGVRTTPASGRRPNPTSRLQCAGCLAAVERCPGPASRASAPLSAS